MSNLPSGHQESSSDSSNPHWSVQKPTYLWPAHEHDAPENPDLYGNGTYDGIEVAPTTEKEHATETAHTVGGDKAMAGAKRKRRVCGLPLLAFCALISLLAVVVIVGAVLGGVLGSKASKRATEERVSSTGPTETLAEPTSIAAPEATESSYSGPLRSDEWHYIFWPKEGSNIALTAHFDPRNITSGSQTNNTFDQVLDNLHNATRPRFGDPSNHTQHWQFLEIPRTLKATDGVRKSIGDNITLYWVANRALGQHLRLTTDESTSQDPSWLPNFNTDATGLGSFQQYPLVIRVANDRNPAQWWYIGDTLDGEESPGEGWWMANAYTRTANPDGNFEDFYVSTEFTKDTNASSLVGTAAFMDGFSAAPWNIVPIENITDDGWRVS